MALAHHTKQKGDLGVLKAQVDLFEQGYAILAPLTEHSPFDLVAYRDGEFRRVQVKYRKLDKDEVDLYCVYCPDTDECYYLNPKEFGSNATLRVEAPKNGQMKNVKFAADYRRAP